MLEANGADGLATVALRPSGIFGEGDPLFVPVLVDKARVGKLKYIIGNGSNLMDFTYVGNVAHAHVLVRLRSSRLNSIPPRPCKAAPCDAPSLCCELNTAGCCLLHCPCIVTKCMCCMPST